MDKAVQLQTIRVEIFKQLKQFIGRSWIEKKEIGWWSCLKVYKNVAQVKLLHNFCK
jgi:hypothetical protein